MNNTILEISSLSKSFNGIQVLKNINLLVEKGEVVVIIGTSGSGKTTLLRCINLLETPESGTIKIDNQIIFDNGLKKDIKLTDVRQKVGMVFQNLNLWPHKTVLENITITPILLGKFNKAVAQKKAVSLLSDMKLLDKKDDYTYNLSGGEQQRVAICRALIMDPDILLLDEITSALDPELVGEVLETISELAKGDRAMLIITHEMMFAREVANRVVFIDEGAFIEEGNPKDVLSRPKKERTKIFLSRVTH